MSLFSSVKNIHDDHGLNAWHMKNVNLLVCVEFIINSCDSMPVPTARVVAAYCWPVTCAGCGPSRARGTRLSCAVCCAFAAGQGGMCGRAGAAPMGLHHGGCRGISHLTAHESHDFVTVLVHTPYGVCMHVFGSSATWRLGGQHPDGAACWRRVQ